MINTREKLKEGTSEKEIEVSIDNGDLELIDSLVDAYVFKDRSSLFKFAIAALLKGNNNEGLYTVKNEDNVRLLEKITPSEDMLKQKSE